MRRFPHGVRLHINNFSVDLPPAWRLFPLGETKIMITVNVGHPVKNTIQYLDQHGNPMLTPPVLTMPPVWTNSPSPAGADTLTVSPDGTEADLAALEVGVDTLSLTVTVGAQTFMATVGIIIAAEPQVLTSVAIISMVG